MDIEGSELEALKGARTAHLQTSDSTSCDSRQLGSRSVYRTAADLGHNLEPLVSVLAVDLTDELVARNETVAAVLQARLAQ
jgi:hypothetical protein